MFMMFGLFVFKRSTIKVVADSFSVSLKWKIKNFLNDQKADRVKPLSFLCFCRSTNADADVLQTQIGGLNLLNVGPTTVKNKEVNLTA